MNSYRFAEDTWKQKWECLWHIKLHLSIVTIILFYWPFFIIKSFINCTGKYMITFRAAMMHLNEDPESVLTNPGQIRTCVVVQIYRMIYSNYHENGGQSYSPILMAILGRMRAVMMLEIKFTLWLSRICFPKILQKIWNKEIFFPHTFYATFPSGYMQYYSIPKIFALTIGLTVEIWH
jgi:hypothetical protein